MRVLCSERIVLLLQARERCGHATCTSLLQASRHALEASHLPLKAGNGALQGGSTGFTLEGQGERVVHSVELHGVGHDEVALGCVSHGCCRRSAGHACVHATR